MTGKTLVYNLLRPLIGPSFWMVLGFLPLLLSAQSSAQLLEMTEVISNPQHYDRKEVVVMGQVDNVQPVTDRQGKPAFQFLLKDSSGTLKVTSRTQVQNGDQVIVMGTFTRRRQGGRIAVYNEVNAVSIRPLNEFDSDLIG